MLKPPNSPAKKRVKKPIEQYGHPDKTRANISPVGRPLSDLSREEKGVNRSKCHEKSHLRRFRKWLGVE
jgi:hypothetical protein